VKNAPSCRKAILTSILFTIMILFTSCQPDFNAPLIIKSSKRIISRIDPSWHMYRENLNGVRSYHIDQFSPDGQRVAYRASNNEGRGFVVVDNTTGHLYDLTVAYTFSPDSRHFAYIAKADNDYFVVRDGIEGKHYQGEISLPVFSPDSQKLAYIVGADDEYRVVINSIEGKSYDEIMFDNRGDIPGITFSPDSRQIAYVAGTYDTSEDRYRRFTVINGVEGENQYDRISGVIFSPDSKRTAFTVTINHQSFAVIDGIQQPFEGANNNSVFSPDSERVSYAAGSSGSRYIVTDGKKGEEYNHVSNPVFCPDSKKLVYKAERDGKWRIVINGREGKGYEYIKWPVVISPDSDRFAYIVRENNEWFVVVDGEESEHYRQVSNLAFSPDSKNIIFAARSIRRPGNFLVINGIEGESYSYIYQQPVFSPDSGKIAYAVQNVTYEMVVVNSIEGEHYNRIIGGILGSSLTFDSPDSLHYLAQSGNDIYLVEQRIIQVE
jgi:Tol biopolymer transport system component